MGPRHFWLWKDETYEAKKSSPGFRCITLPNKGENQKRSAIYRLRFLLQLASRVGPPERDALGTVPYGKSGPVSSPSL